MKLLFVVGGSYKAFYLNQLKNINNVDIVIFQQGIFYDFDYEEELLGEALVSKELLHLNGMLGCPIIVFGQSNLMGNKSKCLIACVNNKISIISKNDELCLFVKRRSVVMSSKLFARGRGFVTISLLDKKAVNLDEYKNMGNNYFICDKTGVTKIKNGQIYRKFRKYCYFRLP